MGSSFFFCTKKIRQTRAEAQVCRMVYMYDMGTRIERMPMVVSYSGADENGVKVVSNQWTA